jgi:hypothetical protein
MGAEALRNAKNTRTCIDQRLPTSIPTTIGTPAEHLDLATVVKLSQTLSGEIVLKKLLNKLS